MRTEQELSTRIDARNGVTSIALSGELDMATAPILNDQLTVAEQDGSRAIMLDLRDLRFVDSSGLHAILQAYRRSETNGHRFLVVGANTMARRLCQMTGTEFLLDAEGTAQMLDRFTGTGSPSWETNAGAGAQLHV